MLVKKILLSLIFSFNIMNAQTVRVTDLENITKQSLIETQNKFSKSSFKVNVKDDNRLNMSKTHTYEEIDIEYGVALFYIFTDENYLDFFIEDIFLNKYKLSKEMRNLLVFKKNNKVISITNKNSVIWVSFHLE